MKDKIEELTKAYQDAGAEWRSAQRDRAAIRDGKYANTGEWTTTFGGHRPPAYAITALDLKIEEARDREWKLAGELRPLLMAAEIDAGDPDAVACDPSTVLAQATAINDDEARAREVLKGINHRRDELFRRVQAAALRLCEKRVASNLPNPSTLPPLTDLERLRANAEGTRETESPYTHAVRAARVKHTEALASAERQRIEAEKEKEERKMIVADRDKRARAAAAEDTARIAAESEAARMAKEETERLAAAFVARKGDAA